MEAPRFDADVRERDGVAVIELAGQIDRGADAELSRAYGDARELATGAILLDFSRVEYINSTGIALIVGILAQARKSGTRVLSSGLSDHYREIFEITRLADFMELYSDEESAVATEAAADRGGNG
jgi:anti-anti-sigma factor